MCENCEKNIRNDGECRCPSYKIEKFSFVHHGNFDEIFDVCLNCGNLIL